MDFDFNVTSLVGGKDIFIVNNLLKPAKSSASLPSTQKHLCTVIDRLGEASAKAQGLPAVITTSTKLSYTDQRIYMYTDCSGNGGKGSAVGFIKVGTKKLFLYDHHGNQRETEPMCILDFYVHESKQRQGYGKKLYEFMLENERIIPTHLAVDRPSNKFLAFLTKHYKLRVTIPQVNNYVIFDGFFTNRRDKAKRRSNKLSQETPTSSVSHNPMAANDIFASYRSLEGNSKLGNTSSSSPSPSEELASLSNIPIARPSSREKLVGSRHSPALHTAYQTKSDVPLPADLPALDAYNYTVENLPESVSQLAVSNGSRSQSAQNTAYSRHSSANSSSYRFSTSNQRDYQEPIRTRYGQPNVVSTLDKLNTHQLVQNKQGHLKVTPHTHHMQEKADDWSKNFHNSGKLKQPASSWNVFGVPPGYSHVVNRKAF